MAHSELLSDWGAGQGPTGLGECCIRWRSSSSEDCLAATGSSRCFSAGENHRWNMTEITFLRLLMKDASGVCVLFKFGITSSVCFLLFCVEWYKSNNDLTKDISSRKSKKTSSEEKLKGYSNALSFGLLTSSLKKKQGFFLAVNWPVEVSIEKVSIMHPHSAWII